MRRADAAGFTLVELLVVILIVGVLAAIAVPLLLAQRRTAVTAGVENDIRNMAIHLETSAVENQGLYPATVVFHPGDIVVGANLVYKSDPASGFSYEANVARDNYVICGNNPKSTAPGPPFIVYVANQGGFQPQSATCPAP